MGYEQSMGYDAQSFATSQSFAAQQAEAELAALEESKKAKEVQHRKQEVEHLGHKLRSLGRDHKDNQACARTLCMFAVFNALMYGLALTGDGWINTSWWSMGIRELRVTFGLFNMNVDLECQPDSVNLKICNMMRPWADHDGGHWTTMELWDTMCHADTTGMTEEGCNSAKWIYRSGWPPLILFPCAAGLECLSLMVLYWYWHGKPCSSSRILAEKLAMAALVCGGLGFVGYMAAGPWLTALPRKWADMAGRKDETSGSFTGLRCTWVMPVGWSLMCGLTALGGNFIRLMSLHGLPFHVDEPDPLGIDESRKLMAMAEMEAERMAYGTNAEAGTMAF